MKYLPVMVLAIVLGAPAYSQTSSVTRVYTVPDGAGFFVDGTYYNHAASLVWPAGSKHVLNVNPLQQRDSLSKTQYVFANWAIGGAVLPQNPLTVTADAAITEIHAVFTVGYALSIRYYPCASVTQCMSPGTVYVNGSPTIGDQDLFFAAGTTVVLQAAPNSGYTFTGWQPGFNQSIQGFLDTVVLNTPVTVYPGFKLTRSITLNTDPPGLQVLADRTPVFAPITLQWAWDSAHVLGPVSPQQDIKGVYWVFSSWSDGGDTNHAYQVAEQMTPDTVTATYVRGEPIGVITSPPGLKVKIDGRDNWPTPTFLWGVGETHHLEAPLQQTDAQGRTWSFTAWSNAGTAAQDFVVPADKVDGGVQLTATYQPLGRLTVNSSVAGLAVQVDGSNCSTPCVVQRPFGTQVRVSVPASVALGPGTRADFVGWSDDSSTDRVFTLGSTALSVTANFHSLNLLTALANPPEGATWQIQPASPDGFYDSQATVKVNLTTLPGFKFRQWEGDLSGSSPAGVVAMSAPRMVRAQLDRVPYIAPAGVVNAAAATPQSGIAPGSIASIFGAGMGSDTALGPASPLTQSLHGVIVTSGDRILPLFFISPTQINFLLPPDFPVGTAGLTVSAPGQADLRAVFQVVRNAPGLFQQVVDGQAFGLAFHEDGSAINAASPAKVGELVTAYGTGFGPTGQPRPAGFAVPPQPQFSLTDTVSVTVGDGSLAAEAAFAAPGLVGIDAVQFRVSDNSLSGTNASLRITVNGQDSNTVLLPVQ